MTTADASHDAPPAAQDPTREPDDIRFGHGADPEVVEQLAHWLEQLERMEDHIDEVESILGAGGIPSAPDWTPPTNPPPFPTALLARARLVRERQMAAADEIAKRLTSTEAEITLTNRIRENAEVDIPVYLDIRT